MANRIRNRLEVGVVTCTLLMFAGAASANDLSQLSGQAFDHAFAHKFTMHHKMGIEMNEMCQDKAQSDDLKEFCQKSAASMENDIQKLDEYADKQSNSDKNAATQGAMASMHQQHGGDMQKLQQAEGSEFDRVFVAEMSKHHKQGMPDIQTCQQKASEADLKQLCQKMASSQKEELQQLDGIQQALADSGATQTGSRN